MLSTVCVLVRSNRQSLAKGAKRSLNNLRHPRAVPQGASQIGIGSIDIYCLRRCCRRNLIIGQGCSTFASLARKVEEGDLANSTRASPQTPLLGNVCVIAIRCLCACAQGKKHPVVKGAKCSSNNILHFRPHLKASPKQHRPDCHRLSWSQWEGKTTCWAQAAKSTLNGSLRLCHVPHRSKQAC